MIHEIIRDSSLFGLIVLLSFLFNYNKSVKYWYILILFFVVGFADNLSYTLISAYPYLQIIKSNVWNNYLICNWSAKLYSVIFALIILLSFKNIISPEDIGIRFKQNKDSVKFSLIFLSLFFFTAIIVGLLSRKGNFDTKTLIYLAVMPGLNEELIYRGFLLGFLNKIYDKKFKILNTYFGWGAIITSIVFGLLHGYQITANYQIRFNNISNIILASVFGFIFALMKEKSDSLVFPVIAHNTVDFFNYLIRMI